MSGVAGIIRLDGAPAETGRVRQMADRLSHRGPDGIEVTTLGSAACAHMFLRTREIDRPGLAVDREEQRLLVLDGRIDNAEEIRAALPRARTESDAELLLAGYRAWGEGLLDRIDGDFAFALWDGGQRQFLGARDRTGIRPFFYWRTEHGFHFASEPHALLAIGDFALNEGVLAETLGADWISQDETLWTGLQRLPPGRRIVVDPSGTKVGRYWFPERLPAIRYRSDADYVDHYRESLFRAVRRQSCASTPIGFDVSGGLDSSALFAVADSLDCRGNLRAPAILGYTLAFDRGTPAFELDHVTAVAAHLGRGVEEVDPELKPLDWFSDAAARYGMLASVPNGAMHMGTHRRCHADGGRVYVDGVGGDQWLARGDIDLADQLHARDLRGLRATLLRDASAFGLAGAARRLIRHGVLPVTPIALRRTLRGLRGRPRPGEDLLSPRLGAVLRERRAQADRRRPDLPPRLRRLLTLEDGYHALASEMIEHAASRAGIERRAPYMDRAFVETVLRFPLDQFRRGRTDRHVHREAMRDLLPESVRTRTTKAEFSIAGARCLRDIAASPAPLSDVPRDWLREGLRDREVGLDASSDHAYLELLQMIAVLCTARAVRAWQPGSDC